MCRSAFVTFLMLNDSYLPGALLLARALRRQRTGADLVCLVAEGPSDEAVRALGLVYDHVVRVPLVYVPHRRRQERQDRPYWFTRWNALRLGPDGDLGCRYDKIVLLDADVLPLRRYGTLLDVPAPAGIPNERRAHFWDPAAGDRAHIREWGWQRAYGDLCPHGRPIPREITDRVAADPRNMGLNGALFVFAPALAEFHAILEDVRRPTVARLVGDLYDWPDMQYITGRWSGRWHCVDVRYSGYCGFPNLAALYGTHYAGVKPWYLNRDPGLVRRYLRHEDFQYWFAQFHALLEEYPALGRVGRLGKLRQRAEELVAGRRPAPRTGPSATRRVGARAPA